MSENKMINTINKHVQNNFWLYIVTLLFFLIGIVIGIYTVKYMGDFEKSDLGNYLSSFTNYIKNTDYNSVQVLLQAIKNNLPIMILLWILGLTLVGIPVVLLINLIKGFTVGFTISFIINGMGITGLWVALIGVIPQNIIYLPCIAIASVISMEYALKIMKTKSSKQNGRNISAYSFSYLILIIIMSLGVLLEAYFTPNLIKYIVISSGSVF